MLQKIIYVFTKKYREETKYLDLKDNMKKYIGINNNNSIIKEKVERFGNYDSTCCIKVS